MGLFLLLLMVLVSTASASAAEDFMPALLGRGTQDFFLSLFDPGATVNDVFAGLVGWDQLKTFRREFQQRLELVGPQSSALQLLRVTKDLTSSSRCVVEQLLPLERGWVWDECSGSGSSNSTSAVILFTTVAEVSPTNGKLRSVRLYYPSYPIMGVSVFRPPILSENSSATTGGQVSLYQQALRAGNATAVAQTFEADGYFREPSGAYHSGAYQGVFANFQMFFSLGDGGGIDLEHCAVTQDGVAFVLEYNCVGWGGVPLKSSAGVATYELGRSAHIMGARVNDNVSPPPPRRRPS